MVKSYSRGHLIRYDSEQKRWVYVDNGSLCDYERPCKRCGRMPDENGHDACIGDIPGVISACCGHGKEEGYIVKVERMDTYEEWPYESCKFCGNRIIPGYDVADEIWEKVIGKEITVCLACFDREAQKKNIIYEIEPIFRVFMTSDHMKIVLPKRGVYNER